MAGGKRIQEQREARERARRRRRSLQAGLLAGAVVVAGVAGVRALTGGDDAPAREGSVLVASGDDLTLTAEAPLGIDPLPVPESYRIDYRIEVGPSGEELTSLDRVLVARPFASRQEAFADASGAGDATTATIATLGAIEVRSDGPAVIAQGPPAAAPGDNRLLPSILPALEAGQIELREVREVLGRRCRVVRSADPLAVSDLFPSPGPDDATDTCIDGAGIVLEEVSLAEGERVSRRLAVDIDLNPATDDGVLDVGEPTVTTTDGGGFFAEMVPGTRTPGPFFEPDTPSGFDLLGRYAVIPAQPEAFSDPGLSDQRLTFVSDVFTDGPDVVVLDQGGTFGGVDPFPEPRGVEIDLAIDGEGDRSGFLTFGRSGPVLLVPLDTGRFVRARGTVAPEVLVDILASLEQVEGGELQLVEDQDLPVDVEDG